MPNTSTRYLRRLERGLSGGFPSVIFVSAILFSGITHLAAQPAEGKPYRPASAATTLPAGAETSPETQTVFDVGELPSDSVSAIKAFKAGKPALLQGSDAVAVSVRGAAAWAANNPELVSAYATNGLFVVDADTKRGIMDLKQEYSRGTFTYLVDETSGVLWVYNRANHTLWSYDTARGSLVNRTNLLQAAFNRSGVNIGGGVTAIESKDLFAIMNAIGKNDVTSLKNAQSFLESNFGIFISKKGIIVDTFTQLGTVYLPNGTEGSFLVTAQKFNVAQFGNEFFVGAGLSLVDITTLLTNDQYEVMARDILSGKSIAAFVVIVAGSILKQQGKLSDAPSDILDMLNLTPSQIPSGGLKIQDLVQKRTSDAARVGVPAGEMGLARGMPVSFKQFEAVETAPVTPEGVEAPAEAPAAVLRGTIVVTNGVPAIVGDGISPDISAAIITSLRDNKVNIADLNGARIEIRVSDNQVSLAGMKPETVDSA